MEDPHGQLLVLLEKYGINPNDPCNLAHLHGQVLEDFYLEYQAYISSVARYNSYKVEAERQVTVQNFRKEFAGPVIRKRVALTICPEQHTTYHILDKVIELVKSCTAISGGKYVYEQRSEDDENEYGWHVHLVVDSDYRPSKVKQFVQQKLKTKGINATYYATYADSKWETNYMEGKKFDKKKDKKVAKDALLRAKYGLTKVNII